MDSTEFKTSLDAFVSVRFTNTKAFTGMEYKKLSDDTVGVFVGAMSLQTPHQESSFSAKVYVFIRDECIVFRHLT